MIQDKKMNASFIRCDETLKPEQPGQNPCTVFTEKLVYKPESEFGTSQCGEYKV